MPERTLASYAPFRESLSARVSAKYPLLRERERERERGARNACARARDLALFFTKPMAVGMHTRSSVLRSRFVPSLVCSFLLSFPSLVACTYAYVYAQTSRTRTCATTTTTMTTRTHTYAGHVRASGAHAIRDSINKYAFSLICSERALRICGQRTISATRKSSRCERPRDNARSCSSSCSSARLEARF